MALSNYDYIVQKLDDINHDTSLDQSTGSTSILIGSDAIKQAVKANLLGFLGEWFLDSNFGLPWYDEILVHNAVLSRAQASIVKTVFETPGVSEITKFNLSVDASKRSMTVTFDYIDVFGVSAIENEVTL